MLTHQFLSGDNHYHSVGGITVFVMIFVAIFGGCCWFMPSESCWQFGGRRRRRFSPEEIRDEEENGIAYKERYGPLEYPGEPYDSPPPNWDR